jgi:ketosteroid isomerase-like protein
MPQDELNPLRAEYAAMSRKDWDAVLGVAHPDFELTTPGGGLDVETIRGVESARRAFEDFFSPHLWTMRDGKAMRLEIFPRRDKALEAAGLSGEDA